MEPGWVFVKIADPKPEPHRIERLLRQTIDAWFEKEARCRVHDWTRAEAGDFHHFHQRWIGALTDALNGGVLPPEFMALAEQVTGRPIPDVVTLASRTPTSGPGKDSIAVVPAPLPPSARVIQRFERINYAKRADRVVIRHGRGRVVAIIEIVSPGNGHSRQAC